MRSLSKILISGLIAPAAAVLISACGALDRGAAVPEPLQPAAAPYGIKDVRYRPLIGVDDFVAEGLESIQKERADRAARGESGPLPPANFLAISGGGDNGAFGAGLLNGWTAAGTRPEFKLVTGISTGALIAPFAFLGPAYDDELREVYTNVGPDDILKQRSWIAALTSDAVADSSPLLALLGQYVDRPLLDAIAEQYARGRLLLIGTTDLDAGQPVIWNLTRLATVQEPWALDLFRRLMLASASIPGVFPPVMLDVETDGEVYQEMHVDGGVMAQVIVYPPAMDLRALAREARIDRERHLYIIRNARLDPNWISVERQTLDIAGRAISALIQMQGIGDLYRIFQITQRDGVNYNLTFIPADFNVPHPEEFDTAYMRALFDVGFEMAKAGNPWQNKPPYFVGEP